MFYPIIGSVDSRRQGDQVLRWEAIRILACLSTVDRAGRFGIIIASENLRRHDLCGKRTSTISDAYADST